MNLEGMKNIQKILGYNFVNLDLLQQAFVRRSYSEECGGQNNEVLEFIGDKALDFAVIRIMMNRFGKIIQNRETRELKLNSPKYFATKYDEGEFTDIKMELVNRSTLARCVQKAGLDKYLIMGKSDIHNKVEEQASVKEDLFEAIIGAVAVDCNYDMDIICKVVGKLIDFEAYFNGDMGQEEKAIFDLNKWVASIDGGVVEYSIEPMGAMFRCTLTIEKIHLQCCGVGATEIQAQEDSAQSACEILDDSKILAEMYIDEVGTPDEYDAIQQVNELRQKGMIYNVNYKFEAGENPDGSVCWHCILTAENIAYEYGGDGSGSTKKEAQHIAAYDFLLGLMKYASMNGI